jgi:EamA domain-containing membrane protein RarD
MIVFLLVAAGVTLGLSGDYYFKLNQRLWLGVLLYAASGLPVWCSYRLGTWMQVAFLWSILAILVSGVIGLGFFHETLSLQQWIAFGLAAVAVVLWNWS